MLKGELSTCGGTGGKAVLARRTVRVEVGNSGWELGSGSRK